MLSSRVVPVCVNDTFCSKNRQNVKMLSKCESGGGGVRTFVIDRNCIFRWEILSDENL